MQSVDLFLLDENLSYKGGSVRSRHDSLFSTIYMLMQYIHGVIDVNNQRSKSKILAIANIVLN